MHWTTKLTTREVADQIVAATTLGDDFPDDIDDAELLELVQVFVDRLPATHDAIPTLNVYVVPEWHGDACTLTTPHLQVIHNTVNAWIWEDDK